MLHVYVRARLLPREEVEPVAADAEQSGSRIKDIRFALALDKLPNAAVSGARSASAPLRSYASLLRLHALGFRAPWKTPYTTI
jgi:hypothetical protein